MLNILSNPEWSEYSVMANGIRARIRYIGKGLYEVEFEDGTKINVKYATAFGKGYARYPGMNIHGRGRIGSLDTDRKEGSFQETIYKCQCRNCGYSGKLRVADILGHKCDAEKDSYFRKIVAERLGESRTFGIYTLKIVKVRSLYSVDVEVNEEVLEDISYTQFIGSHAKSLIRGLIKDTKDYYRSSYQIGDIVEINDYTKIQVLEHVKGGILKVKFFGWTGDGLEAFIYESRINKKILRYPTLGSMPGMFAGFDVMRKSFEGAGQVYYECSCRHCRHAGIYIA